MIEDQRQRAEERGSFGLKSMRVRITTLGGELAVESAGGSGACVRGWLPVPGSEGEAPALPDPVPRPEHGA